MSDSTSVHFLKKLEYPNKNRVYAYRKKLLKIVEGVSVKKEHNLNIKITNLKFYIQ
jgi:hypothetical protein